MGEKVGALGSIGKSYFLKVFHYPYFGTVRV
jgi:hypothetical protein